MFNLITHNILKYLRFLILNLMFTRKPMAVKPETEWFSQVFVKIVVFAFTPNGDATAFVQGVQKIYQRVLGSPRYMHKISNLRVIASTQRPYRVPTASTRCFYSVFTAFMTLLRRARRCCSVITTRSRRAYSVLTALIAFKVFFSFFFLF